MFWLSCVTSGALEQYLVNDCTTNKILKSQYIFKNFILFIFNWSVYPLISSTKSGPRPELEDSSCQLIVFNQIHRIMWSILGSIICQSLGDQGSKWIACTIQPLADMFMPVIISQVYNEIHVQARQELLQQQQKPEAAAVTAAKWESSQHHACSVLEF